MISTPIGNLGDLSPRALEALKGVDEVWCEDTRHTRQLLSAFGIAEKTLRRVDQHTSDSVINDLLDRVQKGALWIGLVTDAGTPGLSDPGARLVQLMGARGDANLGAAIRLEPIPGPSALSALVSVGGFFGNSFLFQGFFPRTTAAAQELLGQLRGGAVSPNWIFFESPHRIRETADCLQQWCGSQGVEPHFVFAKEISKAHERIYRGKGESFLKFLQDPDLDTRGEWVFAVILSKDDLKREPSDEPWEKALECLVLAEVSPKIAAQIIAGRFSVAKNLAYKRALDFQKKAFLT